MPAQDQGRLSGRRLAPFGVLVAAGLGFVALGGRHYLSFATLAENREWLCGWVARSEVSAALLFTAAYAAATALSVPGAVVFTIAGGFLFGPIIGTICALAGATLGATAVFLAARTGLAGLAERVGPRLRRLEAGFREDAVNYLLVLRLVPIFPFWLVNLVAGAIGMRLSSYVIATFVGMIPACLVYASFGHGLGSVIAEGQRPHPGVLLRPNVLIPLIGLAVLAILPVLYKRWRARRGRQPA
ncbi:MAG: TVP38/TMEM64 family protein [Alphaproteobacteria bacterium]|nr:TVP38/TMEM64 family protein [Alphaproteobacteria bacterium]MBV9862986.1 TVP38/TMEM64 family protein [Alphaproteobacteria bacterium]